MVSAETARKMFIEFWLFPMFSLSIVVCVLESSNSVAIFFFLFILFDRQFAWILEIELRWRLRNDQRSFQMQIDAFRMPTNSHQRNSLWIASPSRGQRYAFARCCRYSVRCSSGLTWKRKRRPLKGLVIIKNSYWAPRETSENVR